VRYDPMFDTLFSFIDPVIEPTGDDLSHFIAQAEAFFASGEARKPTVPLTEETYKQMWMLRYQQHLGNLSFLELLDKYEEILGVSSHNPSE
jgi:hypothetical protein